MEGNAALFCYRRTSSLRHAARSGTFGQPAGRSDQHLYLFVRTNHAVAPEVTGACSYVFLRRVSAISPLCRALLGFGQGTAPGNAFQQCNLRRALGRHAPG